MESPNLVQSYVKRGPYIGGSPPVFRIRFFRTNAGGLTLVWTVGANATAPAPAVVVSANASLPRRVLLQQNHTHEKNRLAQDLIDPALTDMFCTEVSFFRLLCITHRNQCIFMLQDTNLDCFSAPDKIRSQWHEAFSCTTSICACKSRTFVIFYSKIGTLETMTNVICNGTNENHFVTKNFFKLTCCIKEQWNGI